jgi:ankyrin repeat protein
MPIEKPPKSTTPLSQRQAQAHPQRSSSLPVQPISVAAAHGLFAPKKSSEPAAPGTEENSSSVESEHPSSRSLPRPSDHDSSTSDHDNVFLKDAAEVERLYSTGGDINAVNYLDGLTALQRASMRGHSALVAIILNIHGSDPSRTTSKEPRTPLQLAQQHSHNEVALALLEHIARERDMNEGACVGERRCALF